MLYIMRNRLRHNLKLTTARIEHPESANPAIYPCRYRNEREFLDDLKLIQASLASHSDQNIGRGELLDLIRLVETFGFFLLHLDIRQESTRHSEAVSELCAQIMDGCDYSSLDEEARVQLLCKLLDKPPVTVERSTLSENTVETLQVLDVMAQMRNEVSAKAFGTYVISMTHSASHVLELMWLASLCGLAGPHGQQLVLSYSYQPLVRNH